MKQEHALNADALKNSSNRDGCSDSRTPALDDHAFVTLGSFFAAFFDFDENFDGISDVQLR
jgi:hypothetical protein